MTDEPRSSNVLEMVSRTVTQQDLIEYLSLKLLYEKKRDAIASAINAGALVESGVHAAQLDFKLIVR
jgi:hypothetical protein